ncbi:uncharacterized protein Z520_03744 [Fonsecaea multimorphosa CBS 102226]|uniref:Major facilitator superfamily (MFS) profile domain-containing protein n=1 Tax=Fonsecaea multimorphosa CBS 102226 TaxID=1442371 RepID=A0A0D2KTH0_9EURO|nr:uncharacterized protein Z520_03744 [Fonsecaea multimorphosa CBS 102226]KIY00059.1 hypothetical protein Z520_03744 [Fonsecaea multimorphosa CBS 102226]OAL27260.1 hypothetical protein AYO22_03535 [Fonsecaea multimorphosa]
MAVENTSLITGWRQGLNWKNFLTCSSLAMALLTWGYFAGIIATTTTKTSFLTYMKLIDANGTSTPGSAAKLGAMNSIFQGGGILGVIVFGLMADHIGRKWSIIICAILAVISQAILAGSVSITMFLTVRFFVGMAGYGFMPVLSAYIAELAPAAMRGIYVGMCGATCAFGFALSSYMGVAFWSTNDAVQWRVPLGLGAIIPLICGIIYLWVPESPRYRLMQGRRDEALAIVMSQHGQHGHSDFARAEFFQMERQAQMDMEQDASWSLFLFKPSVRRRCIITCALAFFAQSTGNLVVQNFGQQVLTSLGYGVYSQLCFQAGWITVSPIFNVIGSIAADYFGRRPLLMIGLGLCMTWLSIHTAMVALYAGDGTNAAGLATAVAMFFLFNASYALAGDVCVFIIVGEIFPNHLRGRGATIAFVSTTLTNLVYLQAAPTGLRNVRWKFFLLFIAVTFCGILYVYFFVPETKGIALEELAEIFGEDVAVHARDIHVDHSQVQLDQQAADGTITTEIVIKSEKGTVHKEDVAEAF